MATQQTIEEVEMETRIQKFGDKTYHLTRMANGAWDLDSPRELTDLEWQVYCKMVSLTSEQTCRLNAWGQQLVESHVKHYPVWGPFAIPFGPLYGWYWRAWSDDNGVSVIAERPEAK